MLFYLFFQTINCTFAKNIFAMPQETWYVLGSLKRNPLQKTFLQCHKKHGTFSVP